MGSNERRNKAIMNQFIKELKAFDGEFDTISQELLEDTVNVAEVYAKDLTPEVSGDAKAKWKSTRAYKVTNGFKARLYNNSDHIGYINNGHRMEKHFVPGEWVGSKFEYNPFSKEGVVMGSKTKYVRGKFMLEKATGRAEKYMVKKADQKIEQLKRKYEK